MLSAQSTTKDYIRANNNHNDNKGQAVGQRYEWKPPLVLVVILGFVLFWVAWWLSGVWLAVWTDLIRSKSRPCYQRGSPCQDPAGNRTTRRPPDHRKEMQTAVAFSCLPFIRSGQNHLARQSESGKKTRRTEEEMGRQHQGMDRPGGRQVPEGSGEQGKMEETVCEIISGAPMTLAVKG